jgi:hypothetical protein
MRHQPNSCVSCYGKHVQTLGPRWNNRSIGRAAGSSIYQDLQGGMGSTVLIMLRDGRRRQLNSAWDLVRCHC